MASKMASKKIVNVDKTEKVSTAFSAWRQGESVTDEQVSLIKKSLEDTLLVISLYDNNGGICFEYLNNELRKITDLQDRRTR